MNQPEDSVRFTDRPTERNGEPAPPLLINCPACYNTLELPTTNSNIVCPSCETEYFWSASGDPPRLIQAATFKGRHARFLVGLAVAMLAVWACFLYGGELGKIVVIGIAVLYYLILRLFGYGIWRSRW